MATAGRILKNTGFLYAKMGITVLISLYTTRLILSSLGAVDDTIDFNSLRNTSQPISIMWCSRFINLKHPELPVQLAYQLKKQGYHFSLDMYGNGEEFHSIKTLIDKLNLNACINLCGNVPNKEILHAMRKHSIFLFTSDRNEGWGAVLNEAMANGCVPVASNEIGSVPYLIKDGNNGLIFKSCNIDSLFEKAKKLLDCPSLIDNYSQAALSTMRLWSPKVAAERFLELAEDAFNGTLDKFKYFDGPASWEDI